MAMRGTFVASSAACRPFEVGADRVATLQRSFTTHFEHTVDREQVGEVGEASCIGTVRVRGNRLADRFARCQLPLFTAEACQAVGM